MEENNIEEYTYSNDGKIHDTQRLSELQVLPLKRKIAITQTRIIEWYQHYDGQAYISFSGGKDSTVLLDIARKIYPEIEAVFLDTGLEYPEIRDFVKTKENVTWLKPEMNFKKVIDTYGYPIISKNVSSRIEGARRGQKSAIELLNGTYLTSRGNTSFFNCSKWKYLMNAPFKISNKCCYIMKKDPAHKYGKQSGKYPIIATMTIESVQRKSNWIMNGCNAFDSKNPSSQPMSFWTEQDVLNYIKTYATPYTSVYGDIIEDQNGKLKTTLCDRTGCVFCGFGCHREKEPNRFQSLKITHPKLWEYCMRPKEQGGLGMKEVLDYINVKTEL